MQDSFAPHADSFEEWKKLGYPNARPETCEFINSLLAQGTLWSHQIEAILRTIYSFEILEKKSCLLNIVTGGGKTAIIAAVVFWLKLAHGASKFLVLSPNTIVRSRLEADFASKRVFDRFRIAPQGDHGLLNELDAHVMKPGAPPQGMLESGVILANIQQLYSSSGQNRNLEYILSQVGDVAIFNDEAHNTPAPEYTHVLNLLSSKCRFRLDTTATPSRADGSEPDSEMIYHYGVPDALASNIIKSVVVYQPDVELLRLTYTNPDTGEKRDITALDAEFEEAERGLEPFRWVLDQEPMKKQVTIACNLHKAQIKRAGGKYRPILFVVTMSISEGERVQRLLQREFKIRTLLVTEKSSESDRAAALKIGEPDGGYDAIVSVLMLREGWDVPEVSTILLLRKFSSPVYGQQVIGRGLRRIMRQSKSREELLVVDHPRLGHVWLWRLVAATRIVPVASVDQPLDIGENPPNPEFQYFVNPDKQIMVPPVCAPPYLDAGEMSETVPDDPIELNWRQVLDGKTYDRGQTVISQSKIKSVRSHDLETGAYEVHESPTDDGAKTAASKARMPATRRKLEEMLKRAILEKAAYLLAEAGYGKSNAGRLYRIILDHMRDKMFQGSALADARLEDIEFAMGRIEDVAANFSVPIVAGIVEGK